MVNEDSAEEQMEELLRMIREHAANQPSKQELDDRRIANLLSGDIQVLKVSQHDIENLVCDFMKSDLVNHTHDELYSLYEVDVVEKIIKLILSCEFISTNVMEPHEIPSGCDENAYDYCLITLDGGYSCSRFVNSGCDLNLEQGKAIGMLCEIYAFMMSKFHGEFDVLRKFKDMFGYKYW